MPQIEGSLRRIWTNAGVPTNGAAGTYVNQILPGDLLIDTTNKTLYQNTNTSASPTYTQETAQAVAYGLVADMAANGTATANTVGVSAGAARVDHIHEIGTHDHSGATKGGADSFTGSAVAVVADANVIGGIPVVHRIAIADVGAPTNTNVTLTDKTKIIDVWVIKAGNTGGAGDLVSLYNVTGGATITNDIDLNVADKTKVSVTTIDDAQDTIAAGGVLRVIATKATHCNCVVFVLGLRVT